MTLFRDVAPGESLRIGDTTIVVEHKTGSRVRLRIESPQPVEHRKASTPALAPAGRGAAAAQPAAAAPSPQPAVPAAPQPLLRRPVAA